MLGQIVPYIMLQLKRIWPLPLGVVAALALWAGCQTGQMAPPPPPQPAPMPSLGDAIRIVLCTMYEARNAKGWDANARRLAKVLAWLREVRPS